LLVERALWVAVFASLAALVLMAQAAMLMLSQVPVPLPQVDPCRSLRVYHPVVLLRADLLLLRVERD